MRVGNFGMILTALLPLAAFLLLFLFLFNRQERADLRLVWLRSSVLFTIYLVLVEEVLSIPKWVTRLGLATGWLLPTFLLGGYFILLKRQGENIHLPKFTFPKDWYSRVLLILTAFVIFVTCVVAWLAPPQTWDSLTYHLSRVAHWAQNRSIEHYSTGIERQISMNPEAEMVTLNFYILIGGDRLAAFTQWLAMLGSLIGVSLIAQYLGASLYGQWLAALFAVTLPMGIVQASSTITDYAATYWLVCVAAESLHYARQRKRSSLFYLCLAAGLALLTKGTVIPYLVPFALWVGFLLFRRERALTAVTWCIVAILIVGLVNSGYWLRNYRTYGSILSPTDFGKHLNELRTFRGTVSNLLRNAGQQAGFSDLPAWNDWVALNILKVHVKLGIDLQDPRTTNEGIFQVQGPSNQEDIATNPLHAALILVSTVLSVLLLKKMGWEVFGYMMLVTSAFILMSYLYKWNVFAVRYHLIFFVLMSPAVGATLGTIERPKVGILVGMVLFAAALPWLFELPSRPLVTRPGQSFVRSILVEPRQNLYFANAGGIGGGSDTAIRAITEALAENDCRQIGLMLYGDAAEYLFWVALDARREGRRLEWIVAGTPSAIYQRHDFNPCAIICQGCLEREQSVRGLNFYFKSSGYELFLNPAAP
jgi:hypothetical protein